MLSAYEKERQERIKQNQSVFAQFQIADAKNTIDKEKQKEKQEKKNKRKKQKLAKQKEIFENLKQRELSSRIRGLPASFHEKKLEIFKNKPVQEIESFCNYCKKDKKLVSIVCSICDQKYHVKCLKVKIEEPVLLSDLFYDFQCGNCVQPETFELTRKKSWVTSVQVALWNMTVLYDEESWNQEQIVDFMILSRAFPPVPEKTIPQVLRGLVHQELLEASRSTPTEYSISNLPLNFESVKDAFQNKLLPWKTDFDSCYECKTEIEYFVSLDLDTILICDSCRKRYHEDCLKTKPETSLGLGNNFYEFTCKECSEDNTEIIKKLEMAWPSIIELALWNLFQVQPKRTSTHKKRKNHFTGQEICSYIKDHWSIFSFQKENHSEELFEVINILAEGDPRYCENIETFGEDTKLENLFKGYSKEIDIEKKETIKTRLIKCFEQQEWRLIEDYCPKGKYEAQAEHKKIQNKKKIELQRKLNPNPKPNNSNKVKKKKKREDEDDDFEEDEDFSPKKKKQKEKASGKPHPVIQFRPVNYSPGDFVAVRCAARYPDIFFLCMVLAAKDKIGENIVSYEVLYYDKVPYKNLPSNLTSFHQLAPGWVKYIVPEGQTHAGHAYYHNAQTRVSTWKFPAVQSKRSYYTRGNREIIGFDTIYGKIPVAKGENGYLVVTEAHATSISLLPKPRAISTHVRPTADKFTIVNPAPKNVSHPKTTTNTVNTANTTNTVSQVNTGLNTPAVAMRQKMEQFEREKLVQKVITEKKIAQESVLKQNIKKINPQQNVQKNNNISNNISNNNQTKNIQNNIGFATNSIQIELKKVEIEKLKLQEQIRKLNEEIDSDDSSTDDNISVNVNMAEVVLFDKSKK